MYFANVSYQIITLAMFNFYPLGLASGSWGALGASFIAECDESDSLTECNEHSLEGL